MHRKVFNIRVGGKLFRPKVSFKPNFLHNTKYNKKAKSGRH